MSQPLTIFWHRRDLRLFDNAGLYRAFTKHNNVQPIFIFDTNILNKLDDKADARVNFIHQSITTLKAAYNAVGADLWVFYGNPIDVYRNLVTKHSIENVYTNADYESYALHRDAAIEELLLEQNIGFYTFKDHVIFEKNEVVKDDTKPYTVFTPYSKKWKAKLNPFYCKPYPAEKYLHKLNISTSQKLMSLKDIGFEPSLISFPPDELDVEMAKKYNTQRDNPAIDGTSKLGLHLRFGTISIRQLASQALQLNETFLNELIWRDFYHQITYHFPHINEGISFKPQYDAIEWRHDEVQFEQWCNGQTGYPIVDAGMRQLNTTGYMHNRVRMIVASFLCKHLLIDWRWGEAYFAKKLLDFDFAANNGGWQWASSSGCDAAPYFRIFNPALQTQKFDAKYQYIKQWVPEVDDFTKYPKPIVDHEFARKRCLETYKKALGKENP